MARHSNLSTAASPMTPGKITRRSTGQVWYVGGTNSDDRINLDFVTEPGILQGHHLMTRLTRNSNESGNAEDFFTFDAQVRLDFAATDGDGNLVWNPNDLFADGGSLQNDDPFARAEMLNQRFSDAVALSRLLPPEDDFRAIIIDALGGNDEIVVGPTVQKTVWIDAGDGDDKVLIASGRSILIDQTDDLAARNDSPESAFPLAGPPVITGTAISNPILQCRCDVLPDRGRSGGPCSDRRSFVTDQRTSVGDRRQWDAPGLD